MNDCTSNANDNNNNHNNKINNNSNNNSNNNNKNVLNQPHQLSYYIHIDILYVNQTLLCIKKGPLLLSQMVNRMLYA